MKKSLSAFTLIASVMTAPAAFAAERTVTFAVDNMTCASCPYIVKTTMAAIPGVAKVTVCHPEVDSFVKVPVDSCVPAALKSDPVCVPVLPEPL